MVVDLAGPNRPQTLGHKLYDMVIVDTFSQRFFVVLLAKKSDAAMELMRWQVRSFITFVRTTGESSLQQISPTG